MEQVVCPPILRGNVFMTADSAFLVLMKEPIVELLLEVMLLHELFLSYCI